MITQQVTAVDALVERVQVMTVTVSCDTRTETVIDRRTWLRGGVARGCVSEGHRAMSRWLLL